MHLTDSFSLAFGNIAKAPLRSLLTVLGLAIGIGAILTVLSLGGAGQQQVEVEISRLGVDKVWITALPQSPVSLTQQDAKHLGSLAPASGRSYALLPLVWDNTAAYAQVVGCDDQTLNVHQLTLLAGRFLTSLDHEHALSSIVLDESLCRALIGAPEEAAGLRINLSGRLFEVVGVIADQSVQTFTAAKGCAYLPLSLFAQRFSDRVDEITLSIPTGQDAQTLADEALAVLNTEGDYSAVTLQQEINAARSVIRIFVLVLACVAAVCMLVGGIGIMNILLISVAERRREIGILKALGATRSHICLIFLWEAGGYALTGGGLGIFMGWLMVILTSRLIALPAAMDASLILPTVAAGSLIGLIFGVIPALRAASLTPVDALRQS